MNRRLSAFLILLSSVLTASAQHADFSKMSMLIRELSSTQHSRMQRTAPSERQRPRHVCAFIKINANADSIFAANDCRQLARMGNVYIADIPIPNIPALSLNRDVIRIEAQHGHTTLMDSMAAHINALPVYAGTKLPQAFTGKGTVMGMQDIGFDLTHPTFYDSTMTNYRIKRLWDQLSTDTADSHFYVGNDYTTQKTLLDYAHSRDGYISSHGTHTLGIAAGSGYDSKYRGIAYESDICLVANAVNQDIALIDSTDYDKYTYATDVMGFKYIFDYARSVDKPCVISFSEGSAQDLRGDDTLFYEMLDSLITPGHILVASAGNNSMKKLYFHKPRGVASDGAFMQLWNPTYYFMLNADNNFEMRFVFYGDTQTDTLTIPSASILAMKDSTRRDTVIYAGKSYTFYMYAFPSCYDSTRTAFDVFVKSQDHVGLQYPISFEIVGRQADVEFLSSIGLLVTNDLNPALTAGETTHNILSPSSAPNVISVGATSYRNGFTNYLGDYVKTSEDLMGRRAAYSSVGPTLDGRIKPDVVAPGTDIVSSYSSYYLEKNPQATDVKSTIENFTFNGRTYAWSSDMGTSMSAPAVAGTIALWLEANPRLTVDDIKGVFSRTCTHCDTTLAYPNNEYGYGQIDAYRGLLDVLGLNGIHEISTYQPREVSISPTTSGDIRIVFQNVPQKTFSVKVYSTAGTLLRSETLTPSTLQYSVSMDGIPHGVYAVQVNGPTADTTGSTLIRR